MRLIDQLYRVNGRSVDHLVRQLRHGMPTRLALRAQRLGEHLDWCRSRVPMYHDLPGEGDPFARLASLSPFPKDRLDADCPEALADACSGRSRRDHTSGTSGRTFYFLVTREERAVCRAYETRANELLGLAPGERYLVIWGGHESEGWRTLLKNAVYSRLQNRELQVVSGAGASSLARLKLRLETHAGGVLVTYPSLLHGLCEAGHAELLSGYRTIILTGEAVDTTVFVPYGLGNLRNRYGTREFGAIALGRGNELAYFADRFILEHDAERGLLVTDLAKRAMPMLRYPVGDFLAQDIDGRMDEELGLPQLGCITGRVLDRVKGRSGKLYVGTFWTLTMRRIGVSHFRIRQAHAGLLEIDFVAGWDEEELVRRLLPHLDGEFELHPHRRETIPELSNAKQKIVEVLAVQGTAQGHSSRDGGHRR